MTSLRTPASAAALLAISAVGRWSGASAFAPYSAWFLAGGLVVLLYSGLRATYSRSDRLWPMDRNEPEILHLTWPDYLKVAICWIDAFKRTYAVPPGLYFTGSRYDRDAPLLVTSNYLLTVFLVVRRVRAFNARLLVVDTDGINVWCAAGKGQFSDTEILKQLSRYDRELLAGGKWLTLILPKVGLSGVSLKALREARIRPIIGPLYAKDLAEYLSRPPLKDRDEDQILFGLRSRVFSWLPGFVQVLGYSVTLFVALLVVEQIWDLPAPIGVVGITAFLATAYPVFFPWIPGARFAVKAIWLAAFVSLGLYALTFVNVIDSANLIVAVLFTFGTSIFIGLSFTGNSAVSNYSRVRQETARFLPLNVLFYIGSLAAYVVRGVGR